MQDPTGLSAGTYQLIIGDGHGCQVDTTITLVAPPLITATANVHSAICHGASDGSIDICLLYTSDAADERSSVDLGGRRIIKKKTQAYLQHSDYT